MLEIVSSFLKDTAVHSYGMSEMTIKNERVHPQTATSFFCLDDRPEMRWPGKG